MGNFYIFNRLINEGDVYVLNYEAPSIYDEYSSGKPIPADSGIIKLSQKYRNHIKTDYLAGIFSFPIVSSKFRQLLIDSAVTCLEFHLVHLICQKSNKIDDSYSFLNILDNVPCFDWQNSEFEVGFVREDVVREVRKLRIIEHKIAERDIVRIAEIPSVILISVKLRRIIESSGITGVQFHPLEDFRMP